MFNLGISEMIAIAVIALVLIGPKQLPEVARILGRFLNDLRRTTNTLTDEFRNQVKIDQQKIFDLNHNPEADRRRREAAEAAAEAERKRQEAAHQEVLNHQAKHGPPPDTSIAETFPDPHKTDDKKS
jgi:sec-independent protein translocase protein TatB